MESLLKCRDYLRSVSYDLTEIADFLEQNNGEMSSADSAVIDEIQKLAQNLASKGFCISNTIAESRALPDVRP